MATSQDEESLLARLWEIDWERLVKVAAAIGVALYGFGVVIENIFLAQFAITDFAALKPSCILTGAWASLLLAFATAPYWTSISFQRKHAPKRFRFLAAITGVVLGLMFSVPMGPLILHAIASDPADAPTLHGLWQDLFFPHSIFKAWLGFIVITNVLLLLSSIRGPLTSESLYMSHPRGLVVGVVLLSAVICGKAFYGFVGLPFGGGRLQDCTLYLSIDGEDLSKSIRKQTAGYHDNDGADDPFPQRVLRAALVKTESDRYIVSIRFCTKTTAQAHADAIYLAIDRKLVSAVVLRGPAKIFTDEDCRAERAH